MPFSVEGQAHNKADTKGDTSNGSATISVSDEHSPSRHSRPEPYGTLLLPDLTSLQVSSCLEIHH